MSEAHDIELPEHIGDAVTELVRIAEEYKVLTMYYRRLPNAPDYTIAIGQNKSGVGKVSLENEDALWGLHVTGFILAEEDDNARPGTERGRIYLTAKAYEWVRYHRRNWLGRGWIGASQWGKQVAPLFVAVAAVLLTILQIIQVVLALW
jgi:hypothetical protein